MLSMDGTVPSQHWGLISLAFVSWERSCGEISCRASPLVNVRHLDVRVHMPSMNHENDRTTVWMYNPFSLQ